MFNQEEKQNTYIDFIILEITHFGILLFSPVLHIFMAEIRLLIAKREQRKVFPLCFVCLTYTVRLDSVFRVCMLTLLKKHVITQSIFHF